MLEETTRQRATVRRLIGGAYGRDRVSEALFEALSDGLSFGPRDLPQSGDREWIRGAIAVAIQRSTDAALETLAAEVSDALERAPHHLLERLAASRRWQELGWD